MSTYSHVQIFYVSSNVSLCCLEVTRQILGPFLTDADCHSDICPEIKMSTTQSSVITLNKYLARKVG